VFLGSEDLVVTFIAKRLETRPVSSRVGAFPEVFSVADSRSKSTDGRSKPGVEWGLKIQISVFEYRYLQFVLNVKTACHRNCCGACPAERSTHC